MERSKAAAHYTAVETEAACTEFHVQELAEAGVQELEPAVAQVHVGQYPESAAVS